MKIDSQTLQQIYQNHLSNNNDISRENCPNPEEMLLHIRSRLPRKKKNEIAFHIAKCPKCAREMIFILNILQQEEKLLNNFITSKDMIYKNPISHIFNWKNAVVFTSFFALVCTVLIIFFNSTGLQRFRGKQENIFSLLYPINRTIELSPQKFQWNALIHAEYYILKIFNEELYPIWQSDKITENHLILDYKSIKFLKPGKTYFWMVTAFMYSRTNIESRLEEFKIKKQ